MPDEPPEDGSHGSLDEQTAADVEQTLADVEQTLADVEQTLADVAQFSSDRDQSSSDRDQAASDRDLAAGGDRGVYEFSRDVRRRTALEREQGSRMRLDAAERRDLSARGRDQAGLARDQAAAARDLAMAQRDAVDDRDGERTVTGAELLLRAAQQRRGAAQQRARAAEQRVLAAEDRQAAARDREDDARERLRALADREALARELALAQTDPLTGAHARAAGLADLDRELERCRGTSALLVVAYVDVVGLKTVNQTQGYAAGDTLLKRVVALIRTHLRPCDLIVRLGGDEFLCAMSNMTLHDARQRFATITAALAASPDARSIRTGFAELTPERTSDQSATELIARADSQLRMIHTRAMDRDDPARPAGDTNADRPR